MYWIQSSILNILQNVSNENFNERINHQGHFDDHKFLPDGPSLLSTVMQSNYEATIADVCSYNSCMVAISDARHTICAILSTSAQKHIEDHIGDSADWVGTRIMLSTPSLISIPAPCGGFPDLCLFLPEIIVCGTDMGVALHGLNSTFVCDHSSVHQSWTSLTLSERYKLAPLVHVVPSFARLTSISIPKNAQIQLRDGAVLAALEQCVGRCAYRDRQSVSFNREQENIMATSDDSDNASVALEGDFDVDIDLFS